jgi:hypothetical protein
MNKGQVSFVIYIYASNRRILRKLRSDEDNTTIFYAFDYAREGRSPDAVLSQHLM